MAYDYELLVIGAGPGGLAAAKQAAKAGVRVAIVEQNQLGGTCVNRGCIPKKLMVYAAELAQLAEDATDYGWASVEMQFNWPKFKAIRDAYLQTLQQKQEQALASAGVQILEGQARFLDAHKIAIADRTLTADKILIAVGGKPTKPEISGREHALTSDQLFDLQALPERIAIIGGGYIGVEFASILRGLGTQVTVMNDTECILTGFDDDVRYAVQDGLRDRGITLFCNTTAKTIERGPEGLHLLLTGEQAGEQLVVDQVLIAAGRAPNLESLALEQAGIETEGKAIKVDQFSCTSQPHIFAVGDCTNRLQLTPAARAEGLAVVETLYGDRNRTVKYEWIPSAVCTRPEAASVGQTEAQAREQLGDSVRCYRKEFQPLFHSLTRRSVKVMMKLVVDATTDCVLGIHMVGNDAAEIIASLAIALPQQVTKQDFDRTIGIHPSTAEEFFSLTEA